MPVSTASMPGRFTPSRRLFIIQRADQHSVSSTPGIFLATDTVFLGADDGSGRLLALDGDFYALCATSADMVRQLLERPMEVVLPDLYLTYDAPEDRIRNDLNDLVSDLNQQGLVTLSSSPLTFREKKRVPPWPLLDPLLRVLWKRPVDCRKLVWGVLALARIACRVWGWSSSVTCWRRFLNRNPSAHPQKRAVDRAAAIDASVRSGAARHLFGMGCKERALACWFLLHRSRIPAELVLGVNLYPLSSHCWCEWQKRIYGDDPDRCARYEAIIRYGGPRR